MIPVAQEPIAGYVENLYSLSGLAVANALGINRVNYYKNGVLDVIPADYVVSQLIAAGWYAGLQKYVPETPSRIAYTSYVRYVSD